MSGQQSKLSVRQEHTINCDFEMHHDRRPSNLFPYLLIYLQPAIHPGLFSVENLSLRCCALEEW